MNYKEKVNKPIHTVTSKDDPTFKLLKLPSYDKKISTDTINSTRSSNNVKYTNLDYLYPEIQEWLNDFLEDSLLTSSKIMNKHHLGEKNIYPDIINLLEKNLRLKSKVIRRSILNETTPDEVLSD